MKELWGSEMQIEGSWLGEGRGNNGLLQDIGGACLWRKACLTRKVRPIILFFASKISSSTFRFTLFGTAKITVNQRKLIGWYGIETEISRYIKVSRLN